MTKVRVHNFSISLDGFGTGEGLSLEKPFGHAERRLHQWMFATRMGHELFGLEGGSEGIDQQFAEKTDVEIGVEIMGAGKFGPPGWHNDSEFRGWWGENPPFHTPVIVLTNHEKESLVMEGGTTFHFKKCTPAQAVEYARELSGGLDIRLGGGPTTLREFLRADLVDEMHIVQIPILLGRGVRLWDGLEGLEERFEIESTSSTNGIVHLTFSRK